MHDLQAERNQKSVEVVDAKGIELFGVDAASTRTKREDLRKKLLTEYEKEIPVVIELTFEPNICMCICKVKNTLLLPKRAKTTYNLTAQTKQY